MRFFYHPKAGAPELELSPANVAHAKARRLRPGAVVDFSALDGRLHSYEITRLDRRANAVWQASREFESTPARAQIGLALIDFADILEIAPFLNELGLKALHIVVCERSQRGFLPDEKKLEKLRTKIINSCEQCGRANLLQITIHKGVEQFAAAANEAGASVQIINFGGEKPADFAAGAAEKIWFLVGPEGGFSPAECAKFPAARLNAGNILRAKTAVLAVVSAMLI